MRGSLGGRRVVPLVLLGLLVLLVNGPLLTRAWVSHEVASNGEDVTVRVLDSRAADRLLQLDYATGRRGDPRVVVARVDQATYDAAVRSGQATVRRVRDDPQRYRVVGAVTSRAPLVTTLALDVVLLAGLVLVGRLRRRPELVLRATADLQAAEPGSVLERTEGSGYVVAGVHHASDPGEVRLDLGDRWVRVVLDGHAAAVPLGETARVVGVMIG